MSVDFSRGSVWQNIISQAIPLTLAQLVQLLYNIVDRIYIGHIEESSSLALTGIGLTFPIITLITAFTALFGMGGVPLFSIARGAKNENEAERIMGNVFSLLIGTSILLLLLCYCFRKPILYLFGASDVSYIYADSYLKIYLFGTTFTMLTAGLNGFINAQGFPKIGMMTTVLGAILNLILDPIFIFAFNMGISGAAIATVISQIVSALWVIRFLTGNKAPLTIKKKNLRIDRQTTRQILSLGLAGFITQATNFLVQIICNTTLQRTGGDLYVGVMTVVGSIREVMELPVIGLTNGAQPVYGYNYGAKEYKRVKSGIRFTSITGAIYYLFASSMIILFAAPVFRLFTNDETILSAGPACITVYLFAYFISAGQLAGQSVFQALGYAKHAILFSVFRKIVIVIPLVLALPSLGFGAIGVFMSEPISNVISGIACFLTMWHVVYKKLGEK